VKDYELLHQVAQAVADAETFEAALDETVRLVGELTDWVYGEVWAVSDDGTELVPSDVWYGKSPEIERFRGVTEQTTFPKGVGLPGRVWETGEMEWIHDVSHAPPEYFIRVSAARVAGFRAAIAVPIIDVEQVIAVIVFFLGEPKATDDRLVAIVSTIAILGGLYARKERVLELATDKEELEERFEAHPVGVAVYDSTGRIIDVNPQAEGILGVDAKQLVGTQHDEMVFEFFDIEGEPVPREELAVHRVIESKQMVRGFQVGVTTPCGERWVLVNAAPILNESGEVEEIVTVVEDMTSRYSWEQEIERQNERLSRFASAVSHDLRTPLTTASTALALAREDPTQESFDIIESSLDRMNAIVNDVLNLARQGRTVIAPERVSLATASGQAWESISPPDATLEVVGDSTVSADPERLQRLLENLFRNAIEHGEPTVTIRVGECRGGFFVEDDGPGIPLEEREKVFEMGYTTGETGTGFGLAIVREIAIAHDWEVRATESSIGGARFEVTTGR
jgi:PAS domain S-box-containing protein